VFHLSGKVAHSIGDGKTPANAQRALPPSRRDWFLSPLTNGVGKNAHLAGLDSVRGVAVLFVVLYHCWALSGGPLVTLTIPETGFQLPLSHYLSGLGYGVDIFFVLSGFLLSIPWHKAYYECARPPHVGAYLKRRMLRIVPPYWFMLIILLTLLTGSVIPWEAVASKSGVANVMASLLFMQYLFPQASSTFGVNGAVWTLTIEMIFYLTLPIFVLSFLGRRWQVSLPVAAFVSAGWIFLSFHSLDPLIDLYWNSVKAFGVPREALRIFASQQYPSTLFQFGVGMTLANFWVYRTRAVHKGWIAIATHPLISALTACLGLVLLIYGVFHVEDASAVEGYHYVTHLATTAGTGLMILGSLNGGPLLRSVFAFVPLRFIGLIGYSVFLWHFPLIVLAERYPIFLDATAYDRWIGITLLVLPGVLLLGTVLYLLIEKPFIVSRQNTVPFAGSSSVSVAEALIELQDTLPLEMPTRRVHRVNMTVPRRNS
jgi:peptidoglycan/LPS O-acetylase OafA/YrhL